VVPDLQPPFRAEHVGSLLRPEALKEARERILGPHTVTANLAPHDNAELRAIEDEYVRQAVAMQERLGLKAVTDGELRRRSWTLELILGWDGFAANRTGAAPVKWRDESGDIEGMSEFAVTKKMTWRPGAILSGFKFLKSHARATPKIGLPAIDVIHYLMGNKIDKAIYPDRDAFWSDLIAVYRQELKALTEAGATYVQLDDTSFAFLCDPVHRDYVRSWGEDPDALLDFYAAKINQSIAELPDGVTVMLHQCRGNREGHWAAEGGYDAVADVMFNKIDVDGYFLEYDTARAGDFKPLRLLPKDKSVVLGLVSSKQPALEDTDWLMRRIEEAQRFAPIEQLALSPQCGFASSYRGNPVTLENQEAKLRRIVEVAQRVWGTS
jgi:5-methyltetrahydropteroyltriglutamate--homocysteine methyltransferase